ncbi:unnamed protein product, partial [Closterium sp. NIES-54]
MPFLSIILPSIHPYHTREGWPECKPCSAEEYAQSPPRANCTARPSCNVTMDAAPTYGNCSAVDNQRIKTWAWLTPHICAPLSEDEDLPADTHEPCRECHAMVWMGSVLASECECMIAV